MYLYLYSGCVLSVVLLGSHGIWIGSIFIVPHLLWHGASGFLVSSGGPLHLVAFKGK